MNPSALNYLILPASSADLTRFAISMIRATLPSPKIVAPDISSTPRYILPRGLITV